MATLLHTALNDTANKMPEKAIFRIPGQEISFGEFVETAARLSSTLRAVSVRRGDRVAIHFRKSIESALSIYAIMQAGAAYVPIDPAAPIERVRSILDQSGARVMLTESPLAGKLLDGSMPELTCVIGPEPGDCPGLRCIPWAEAIASPIGDTVLPDATEDDLAYIIFTSGSTGEPKGIMHTHRSGMAYTRMAGELYGIGPTDRLTGISPLHFDMSTFDYLCGPQRGATTTIVPDVYLKLPASTSELVQDEGITVWYSVPSALTQMLLYGAMEDYDFSSLRWVLFGGEPFTPKHLAALTTALPNARFSNVFGPAESNQCTYYHLPGKWREADGQPSIGTDCPHAETRIVHPDLTPVARGETGEMIVRSTALMSGYWNRPELNKKALKSVTNSDGIEETWLLTGDIASVREDGLYAFHGRGDRMVKVRGFRVELDEIEDVMSEHAQVEEASAFQVSVEADLTTIQAAVTVKSGMKLDVGELLDALVSRLPQYAVPQKIEIVDAFPRTSSGKIDWKRLGEEASHRSSEG